MCIIMEVYIYTHTHTHDYVYIYISIYMCVFCVDILQDENSVLFKLQKEWRQKAVV